MTKFEQIGVELQQDARTKTQANRAFSYSCRVCCNRGMRIDCDSCAIAAANALTIASLDYSESRKSRYDGLYASSGFRPI